MSFFNDCGDNGCIWIILIIIFLLFCSGGRDDKCGCGCKCRESRECECCD